MSYLELYYIRNQKLLRIEENKTIFNKTIYY